jgi:hypothetical protein
MYGKLSRQVELNVTPRDTGKLGQGKLGPGTSGWLVSVLSGEVQFLLHIYIMFRLQGFAFDVGVSNGFKPWWSQARKRLH